MAVTSAVVVVIDRLGAEWLGPYGNTWLDTPHFNHLAAQSALFETVMAESPDLAMAYRAYWTGRHAMQPESGAIQTLPEVAAAAGVQSFLVSSDPQVAEQELALSFTERSGSLRHDVNECADEIEKTWLHLLFKDAVWELKRRERPFLLWVHAHGMNGPWDAPLEMRYQFADEDDPVPPDFVAPPQKVLAADYDPDELLGLSHAYAGQVALADLCLGMLLEALDEHPLAKETLLAVTSPRGYPLGEHLHVGPGGDPLYGELLHVPLLLRFPGDGAALTRSQRIAQPHELFSAVAESCGWQSAGQPQSELLRSLRGEATTTTRFACATASGQRAIRTPAWFLRESQTAGDPRHELFAKPDDRWEANEISSRCGEAVELLAAQLDRFEAAARSDQLAELPPLAESLCDVWR
jgi:arylsulfatase A-like enzyme